MNTPLFKKFFCWKRALFYALLALILFCTILIKVKNQKRAEADYMTASHAFEKWDQMCEERQENFSHLQKIMQKHPELYAYYDAKIGQKLLALRNIEDSKPYVYRTLERTKQPHYSDYAQTSLKIGEERYEEALKEAIALKESLIKEPLFEENDENNSALFAFNLMRIAILCQKSHKDQQELEAWKELKKYGKWQENAPPINEQKGFNQLFNLFTIQNATLLDYIQAREESIKEENKKN